jgi:hypothetical protein
MQANTPQRTISRLLRLGVSGAARSSSEDPTAVGELETELALLREENAWLKVERHRPPDAGRIIERMRELAKAPTSQSHEAEGLPASENAQLMVECLAIRNGLLDACKEIQEAMQGIRQRLSGLSVDVQASGAGDRPTPSPITASSDGKDDLELAAEPQATSDLSQNTA